jgi:WD40 repeat protein
MRFRDGTTTLQTAMSNGEIILFDGTTGTEQRRFIADWRSEEQLQAGRPREPSLWEGAFTPDGKTLVTSADETVYLWDVDAGTLRLKLQHPHKKGCRLAVSNDGKMIATSDLFYAGDAGEDTLRLYDVATGEQLMTAKPASRAGILDFSPDSTKLFTGLSRGTATIWDTRR